MFNSILVPVDIAQESSWLHAIPEALAIAACGARSVTVMTVVREMTAMFEGTYHVFQLEKMRADAGQRLALIVAGFPAAPTPVEQEVRFGSIGKEILRAATSHGIDLIVMASHRPGIRDYLIGPNAAYVAQHARCSVLVVRKP